LAELQRVMDENHKLKAHDENALLEEKLLRQEAERLREEAD